MLDRNRFQPPPTGPQSEDCRASGWDWAAPSDYGPADYGLFASAEDYDATGILAGVDPCESRYWWMPELHASVDGPLTILGRAAVVERPARGTHAARRAGSRSTAAA
jgi:hypothetical protein